MKIVLDFRMFGPSFGLGRYNQKLLENLFLVDQENEYVVLLRQKPEGLLWPKNFQLKIVDISWYSWSEQVILPWIISRIKPDLVHFPHFNVPVFYRGAYIITIHDLIMSRFPDIKASTRDRLSFAIKHFFYDLVIKNAIRRAKKIIAVTNFTKQDIIEYFRLSQTLAEKIVVIYEGVSFIDQSPSEHQLSNDKYFLYVGAAYPHKNLEFLIEAFSHFQKIYPDYKLILVGQRNYFYNRLEKFTWEKYPHLKGKIVFTGFVPDADLGAYYQRAIAYIFPSLYEGFGLPPLEAMSCDVPVLSSDASCLPEVLGQAVLYFKPQDINDLVSKMEIITKNSALRTKLVQSGQDLIKKYDWQKMAKEIQTIYLENNK